MKKKILSMLILGTILTAFTGCSNNKTNNTETQVSKEIINKENTYKNYFNSLKDITNIPYVRLDYSLDIKEKDNISDDVITRLDIFNKIESEFNIAPSDLSLTMIANCNSTDNTLYSIKVGNISSALYAKVDDYIYANMINNKESQNNYYSKINYNDYKNNETTNDTETSNNNYTNLYDVFCSLINIVDTDNEYKYIETKSKSGTTYDILGTNTYNKSYKCYVNQETKLPEKLEVISNGDNDTITLTCVITYPNSIAIDDSDKYTDISDLETINNEIKGVMYSTMVVTYLFDIDTYDNALANDSINNTKENIDEPDTTVTEESTENNVDYSVEGDYSSNGIDFHYTPNN